MVCRGRENQEGLCGLRSGAVGCAPRGLERSHGWHSKGELSEMQKGSRHAHVREDLPASRKLRAGRDRLFRKFHVQTILCGGDVRPLGLEGPPCGPPPIWSGLAVACSPAHRQEAAAGGLERAGSPRAAGMHASMTSPPFPHGLAFALSAVPTAPPVLARTRTPVPAGPCAPGVPSWDLRGGARGSAAVSSRPRWPPGRSWLEGTDSLPPREGPSDSTPRWAR